MLRWSSVDCRRRWCTVIAVIALGVPGAAYPDGMEVTSVSTRLVNDIYIVDADLRFDLGADMRSALDNGIGLVFVVEMEVYRPRAYLWDVMVVRSVQRLRLEYHALGRTYVVSNRTTRTRQSYPSLDEALRGLGELHNVAISERRYLAEETDYWGQIRVRLDVEALPAPLRPIAYLSPDWDLSSSWRRWEVQR